MEVHHQRMATEALVVWFIHRVFLCGLRGLEDARNVTNSHLNRRDSYLMRDRFTFSKIA